MGAAGIPGRMWLCRHLSPCPRVSGCFSFQPITPSLIITPSLSLYIARSAFHASSGLSHGQYYDVRIDHKRPNSLDYNHNTASKPSTILNLLDTLQVLLDGALVLLSPALVAETNHRRGNVRAASSLNLPLNLTTTSTKFTSVLVPNPEGPEGDIGEGRDNQEVRGPRTEVICNCALYRWAYVISTTGCK